MIGPTDLLHPSPAPHFITTFQNKATFYYFVAICEYFSFEIFTYGEKIIQGDSLARGPTEVYLQIFNESVNQLTDDELTTVYYQQDGATCHTSNANMREIESFLKTELF